MLDTLLFIILPYVAILICLFGCLFRSRADSARQIPAEWLERKSPIWSFVPWHTWMLVIIVGHLVMFLFPTFWRSLIFYPTVLISIEAAGVTITIVGLIGLFLVVGRFLFSRQLIGKVTGMDMLTIVVLLVQFVLGLITVVFYRWSAQWTLSTTTPYLWSVMGLKPDVAFIQYMPFLVKAHIVNAWFFILLIPFSNLRHVFTLPFRSLAKGAYQSIWNESIEVEHTQIEARRQFLKGAGALVAGGLVLSVVSVEKLLPFFFQPKYSREEVSSQIATRVERLHLTAEQKELELERLRSEFILVAKLSDLSAKTGKYFIDYLMRPALAFLGADNLPLLISAKCTHLGCTVGNQVTNGQILCPCHITYFDIKTGNPTPGAPAKEPLPLLGWVIKDDQGQEVMSKTPDGKVTGKIDPQKAQNYSIYIARRDAEEA